METAEIEKGFWRQRFDAWLDRIEKLIQLYKPRADKIKIGWNIGQLRRSENGQTALSNFNSEERNSAIVLLADPQWIIFWSMNLFNYLSNALFLLIE